ncbi:MAG: OmpA family protein [Alphaproteobacteria bacterium]|nr:OmpA family protein [Alphaproteobacteria bacterium]
MKKFISLVAILMLSGCYTGKSLFDGPACDSKPQPKPQPCVEQVVPPCEQPEPCVQPEVQKTERLAGVIYFGIGSDYLNDADKAELQRIAQYAKANHSKVKVLGHASHKVGKGAEFKKDIINQDISIKRTQNVANTLAMMGVEPGQINAAAYSDSLPAEVERDAKTEALNRRVEIYLEY